MQKIKSISPFLYVIIMYWMPIQSVQANQIFNNVTDNSTIQITLSRDALTRLMLDGDHRLSQVISPEGLLHIQPDEVSGDIFVKPTRTAPDIFSFFLRSDNGATYTLVAIQKSIPSTTVMLRPVQKKTDQSGLAIMEADESTEDPEPIPPPKYRDQPLVDQLKRLIKAMALQEALTGYRKKDSQLPRTLWRTTHLTLEHIYQGADFVGEVYRLESIFDSPREWTATEFTQWRDDTRAVAIEQMNSSNRRESRLYLVRDQGAR
jgi:hypothetical protein